MRTKIISGLMALMLVTSVLGAFAGTAAAAPAPGISQEWSESTDDQYRDTVYNNGYVYAAETDDTDTIDLEKRYAENGTLVWSQDYTQNTGYVELEADTKRGGVFISAGQNYDSGDVRRYAADGTLDWNYAPTDIYGIGDLDYNESADTLGVAFTSSSRVYEVFNLDASSGVSNDVSETDLDAEYIEVTGTSEFVYIDGNSDMVRYDSSSNTEVERTNISSYTITAFEQVGDGSFVASIRDHESDSHQMERLDFTSTYWNTVFNTTVKTPRGGLKVEDSSVYGWGVYEADGDLRKVNLDTGELDWYISENGISWDSNGDISTAGGIKFAVENETNLNYYEEVTTAESLDISISGNTTQYNTTGSQEFEVNATVTYSDGTTAEVSEDSSTTYTYNSTQLNQLTPKDIFEGNSAGTDALSAEFTDSDGATVTDSITVKVEDPPDVQSLELTGLPSDMAKGQEEQLTATVTYEDGTVEDVTDESSYLSTDGTVLSVNSTGYVTAEGAGTASVEAEYTSSWHGTTVSDSQSTTVKVIDHVEFNVTDNNPRKYNNVTMSATLYWSDGSTTNLDDTITATNVTSNKPGRTDFYFAQNKVQFTDHVNFTLTYSATYKGTVISDQAELDVQPALKYEDYNELSGQSQMFVFFSDWSTWAIFASILLGGMVGLKFGGGSGIAVTTMALAMAWVAGLVSIFIPATLILFEIFIMVVLDVQMVDYS